MHGQYNFRRLPYLSHLLCRRCFHSTTSDFVTSSMVHFRSPLYHLSALFKKAFPCPFTTKHLTRPAAQGDLTTLPDIALPMGHYPSSVKELFRISIFFSSAFSALKASSDPKIQNSDSAIPLVYRLHNGDQVFLFSSPICLRSEIQGIDIALLPYHYFHGQSVSTFPTSGRFFATSSKKMVRIVRPSFFL